MVNIIAKAPWIDELIEIFQMEQKILLINCVLDL